MSEVQEKIERIFNSLGLNWQGYNKPSLLYIDKKTYAVEAVIENRYNTDYRNLETVVLVKITTTTGFGILDIPLSRNPVIKFYTEAENIPFLNNILNAI